MGNPVDQIRKCSENARKALKAMWLGTQLCHDGLPIHSYGEGKGRFGCEWGNIVTGADDFVFDLGAAVSRFPQFQDTHGMPLVSGEIFEPPFHIFCHPSNTAHLQSAGDRHCSTPSPFQQLPMTPVLHESPITLPTKASWFIVLGEATEWVYTLEGMLNNPHTTILVLNDQMYNQGGQ